MKAQSIFGSAAGLGILAMLAIGGGCGSEQASSPSDESGCGIVINSVVASPVNVKTGDSTTITVKVVKSADASEPASGVAVRFARVGATSGGEFSKSADITDTQGLVSAVYRPPIGETGQIDLKVVAAECQIGYVSIYLLEPGDDTEEGLCVKIEAAEITIPADGSSTLQLTMTVSRDGLAASGEEVTLAAGELFGDLDHDGVFSEADQLLLDANGNGQWDQIGTIVASCVTNSAGRATATYMAGTTEGRVYIKATVDSTSTDFEVTLHSTSCGITLDISATELFADGLSEAWVTATVEDWEGQPIKGKLVRFTVGEQFDDLNGDGYYTPGVDSLLNDLNGNGTWDVMGQVNSSGVTDAAGSVYVLYISGRTAGQCILYASTRESRASATIHLFELPPVGTAEWSWSSERLYADGISESDLQLQVFDVNGGAIPGKQVHLVAGEPFVDLNGNGRFDAGVDELGEEIIENGEWDALGTIDSVAVADADGFATVTYRAAETPGSVVVKVSAGGWSVDAPIELLEYDGTVSQISQISFQALPPELYVLGVGYDDQAVLEARCYLGVGQAAPAGIAVTFTLLSGPGAVTIEDDTDAAEVLTDSEGIARAVLRSDTLSGPVTVKAAAGGRTKTLYLGISAGPPTGIFWFDPDTRPLGWGDSRPFTVAVHDIYHNPVPEGTVVHFGANTGLIYTPGGTGTDATNAGMAYATYGVPMLPQSGETIPGTAVIYARTDGAHGEAIACTLSIPLPPQGEIEEPGPITRIEVSLNTPEIAVKQTGGVEQCQVIATCYDADNRLVGRDREVEFEIIAGPNGGEGLLESGWGPVTVLTDDESHAVVTLGSGTVSGTVEIEARAGGLLASKSALVSIAAGPPYYISVGINPLNIRGWDVVGAQALIAAYVSDVYNNPVRDSTVVYLTCDEGIIRGNYEAHEELGSSITEGGVAAGTYFSGQPRDDGLVVVTITTSGGSVVGLGGLISSGPPTSVTFVSPTPPVSILADGQSQVKFTVQVLDINGNFVLAGTKVEFDTNVGTVTQEATTADGIYGSIAQGEFTSEVLDRDAAWSSPDNGIGAVASVVAGAGLGGAVNDVLNIDLLTSSAYRQNSGIDIASSVPRGAMTSFDVTIKDRYGNPLGGHLLAISASGGLVTASGTTDQWGAAGSLMFWAPADSGDVVITVVDNDPGYGGISLSQTVTVN